MIHHSSLGKIFCFSAKVGEMYEKVLVLQVTLRSRSIFVKYHCFFAKRCEMYEKVLVSQASRKSVNFCEIIGRWEGEGVVVVVGGGGGGW